MLQDLFKHGGVAVFGNALPLVEEIILDIVFAEGQSVEYGGWQLSRVDLPLFDGIISEEGLIEFSAEEGKGLFFEVSRMGDGFVTDGIHEGVDFEGAEIGMKELVDGLEVDGELVDPVAVAAEYLVAVSIEVCEAMDIIPYFLIGGMKDMCAVAVVFDAGGVVDGGMAIAADMCSFFDDQYRLVELAGNPFCDYGTQQAGADHDKPIFVYIHAGKLGQK